MTVQLESIGFTDPYKYTNPVAVGESKLVWRLRTGLYTGFITKMAVNWYPGTWYDFKVDGRRYEKIERSITMVEPDEYDPPIIAAKKIEFYFHNVESPAGEVRPAVLCDGTLVRRI